MAREIKIRITAETASAQASLAKVEQGLASVANRSNDTSVVVSKVSNGLSAASKSASSMAGTLATAAGAFTGFAAAQVVLSGVSRAFALVKDATFGMNASLETSTLQFETLMGNSDKAREHVKNLFEFAKKTPFETEPIIKASRMLQTFGGDALNTMDQLTRLGNASAATSAPIEELGFWVGRMYANLQAGKPFGEAAMRLTELAVLSPQTRNEMERLAESGASADKVFGTFEKSLDRFSGAMDKQAGSWVGLTSTLSDTLQLLVANGMRPVFDAAKDMLSGLNSVLGSDWFAKQTQGLSEAFSQNLASGLRIASEVFGVLKDAAMGVWDVLKLVWDATTAVLDKLGLLDLLQGLATNLVNGLAMSLSAVGKGLSWVADKIRSLLEYVGLLEDSTGKSTPSAVYKTDIALGAVGKTAAATSTAFVGASAGAKKAKDAIQDLADTLTGRDVSRKVLEMSAGLERAQKQGGLTAYATKDLGKQLDELVQKGAKLTPALQAVWREYKTSELASMALKNQNDLLTKSLDKLTAAKLGAVPPTYELTAAHKEGISAIAYLLPQIEKLGTKVKELPAPPKGAWSEWRTFASQQLDTLERAVSGTFAQMLLGAKGFHDGFLDIWRSIKSAVMNIFTDILGDFTTRFLRGLSNAITGAEGGFTGAFSGMFTRSISAASGPSASAAAQAGGVSGAAWAGSFMSIAGSAIAAWALYEGFAALGRWLGGGPSPERDVRVIGIDENTGAPVYGTGIEQDEYDRRYPSSESIINPDYGTGDWMPMARGGIVTRPTRALIGEAGPEAVIPLNTLGNTPLGGGDIHVHFHGDVNNADVVRKFVYEEVGPALADMLGNNMRGSRTRFRQALGVA